MLIFVVCSFIFVVESRFWEFRFVQPTRFSFSCSCAGVLASRTRPDSIVWSILYDPVGPKTFRSRSLLYTILRFRPRSIHLRCKHCVCTAPTPPTAVQYWNKGTPSAITFLILVGWFSMAQVATLRECTSMVVVSTAIRFRYLIIYLCTTHKW